MRFEVKGRGMDIDVEGDVICSPDLEECATSDLGVGVSGVFPPEFLQASRLYQKCGRSMHMDLMSRMR